MQAHRSFKKKIIKSLTGRTLLRTLTFIQYNPQLNLKRIFDNRF